jgi:hypothetical protein
MSDERGLVRHPSTPSYAPIQHSAVVTSIGTAELQVRLRFTGSLLQVRGASVRSQH